MKYLHDNNYNYIFFEPGIKKFKNTNFKFISNLLLIFQSIPLKYLTDNYSIKIIYYIYILELKTLIYKLCFEDKNIKVLLNFGFDPSKRYLMDSMNGIYIWMQWSIWYINHPQIPIDGHINFIWGKNSLNYLFKNKNEHQNNMIIVGYTHDYLINNKNAVASAAKLKNNIKQSNVEMVVCVFDERLDNDVWPKETFVDMFTPILEECIVNENIAFLIKPKSKNVLSQIDELKSLYQKALNTKRLLNLEKMNPNYSKNNEYNAITASLASDYSISLIGTTGYDSWRSGTPSLYYNPLGLKEGVLFKKNHTKLAYSDIKTILTIIKKQLLVDSFDQKIGDHSLFQDEIDPFNDEKTSYRIGFYIEKLLLNLNKTNDTIKSIHFTNNDFKSKWGEEKIIRGF